MSEAIPFGHIEGKPFSENANTTIGLLEIYHTNRPSYSEKRYIVNTTLSFLPSKDFNNILHCLLCSAFFAESKIHVILRSSNDSSTLPSIDSFAFSTNFEFHSTHNHHLPYTKYCCASFWVNPNPVTPLTTANLTICFT